MKYRRPCIACYPRPEWARGFCAICYQRAYRAGLLVVRPHDTPRLSCRIPGCARPHFCAGLCHTHDMRRRRHGSPDVVKRAGRARGEKSDDHYNTDR